MNISIRHLCLISFCSATHQGLAMDRWPIYTEEVFEQCYVQSQNANYLKKKVPESLKMTKPAIEKSSNKSAILSEKLAKDQLKHEASNSRKIPAAERQGARDQGAFKLPRSKSPVFDAVIFCAVIEDSALIDDEKNGIIKVTSFDQLLLCINTYSSKAKIMDRYARIKALHRLWAFYRYIPEDDDTVIMKALNTDLFRDSLNRVEKQTRFFNEYRK